MPVKTSIVPILNNGDESAVVYFRNTFPENRVALSKYVAVSDGQSGAVLQDFAKPPIGEASAWVQGAHFMQFGHWPLRWLHFLGGLGGCVMIATGMLFWLRSREGRLPRTSAGYRTVEALTIGGVTGLIAATGAFFVANRLIPTAAFATLGERANAEDRLQHGRSSPCAREGLCADGQNDPRPRRGVPPERREAQPVRRASSHRAACTPKVIRNGTSTRLRNTLASTWPIIRSRIANSP